jgi:hypothetical protein
VIETSPGGVGRVPNNQTDVLRHGLDVRGCKDVVASLRFLMTDKGVGLGFFKGPDLLIQATALFVRPAGFAEHALESFIGGGPFHAKTTYAASPEGAP